MKRIFVTGIGTEVGKTIASAVLVQALGADYWKPVQAGELERTDSMVVEDLVARSDVACHPEAARLATPMSPHAAAALEGRTLHIAELQVPQTERDLVIEGAGGLYVPLNEHETMIDLIEYVGAEAVLVSRHYLGSINHTLLSIEALRARAIPLLGVLFVGDENKSTEQIIDAHSGVPTVGRLPIARELTKEWVHAQALQLGRRLEKK